MTISKYFDWTNRNSEQELFNDLVIEHIQMYGYEIYYLPRSVITQDDILGEDIRTIFNKVYKIEALMPDAGNFGGDQNIMSKFGFRLNATAEFMIAKKRFFDLGIPNYLRPQEGDLIWIGDVDEPMASFPNVLFEINQVWYDWPGFQFGKQYVYKLVCESFTFSWERFRTGLKAIDYVEYNEGPGIDMQDPGALNAPSGDGTGPSPLDVQGTVLMDTLTGNPFGNF